MACSSAPHFDKTLTPCAQTENNSMEDQAETKPKVEGQVINLVVKDQSGTEVHFKVKSHTKLEKVREWGNGQLLVLPNAAPLGCAELFWPAGDRCILPEKERGDGICALPV